MRYEINGVRVECYGMTLDISNFDDTRIRINMRDLPIIIEVLKKELKEHETSIR